MAIEQSPADDAMARDSAFMENVRCRSLKPLATPGSSSLCGMKSLFKCSGFEMGTGGTGWTRFQVRQHEAFARSPQFLSRPGQMFQNLSTFQN